MKYGKSRRIRRIDQKYFYILSQGRNHDDTSNYETLWFMELLQPYFLTTLKHLSISRFSILEYENTRCIGKVSTFQSKIIKIRWKFNEASWIEGKNQTK